MSTRTDWRSVLATAADRATAALAGLDPAEWASDQGWGADGTLTAGADKAAEDAALDYLASALPGVTLCSEEAGVVETGGTGNEDVLLIIDPVDGTNNAIRGIPYWAFSVAVVVDSVPVGGFIRNIPAREEFFAWRGETPLWKGAPAAASTIERLNDAVVAIQRPAEPGAFAVAQRVMAGTRMVRLFGAAALDLAAVGCGAFDAYVNVNANPMFPFGEKVVDYAAGAVFVEVAGGIVTDTAGAPLDYSPDLLSRTPVVAAATPALHAAVLAAVAGD